MNWFGLEWLRLEDDVFRSGICEKKTGRNQLVPLTCEEFGKLQVSID